MEDKEELQIKVRFIDDYYEVEIICKEKGVLVRSAGRIRDFTGVMKQKYELIKILSEMTNSLERKRVWPE